MIKYLTSAEIDKARWDLCIEQSLNNMVYGYSWYLDAVAPGWEALVLGDYEAVMPLTGKRKLFIHYLFQPFFTQQLGVFYKTPAAKEKIADFIQAIPSRYKLIDIHLNDNNELLHTDLSLSKRKNYLLDLHKPYIKIQKGYDAHCKRNIKKAKKNKQDIKAIEIDSAIAFYRKHKGEATKNIREHDYKKLAGLLRAAESRGVLLCRGIFNEDNELLAAGIFLVSKGRIVYLTGGASARGRDTRAMYMLFDDLIFQFSDHPVLLDFEGSEIPGIARFFKGFGAEKIPYYKLYINRLPWIVKWLK